jgi:hypothetical protein
MRLEGFHASSSDKRTSIARCTGGTQQKHQTPSQPSAKADGNEMG